VFSEEAVGAVGTPPPPSFWSRGGRGLKRGVVAAAAVEAVEGRFSVTEEDEGGTRNETKAVAVARVLQGRVRVTAGRIT